MSWMVWSNPYGDNFIVHAVFDTEQEARQYRSECVGIRKPDIAELDDDEVEHYRSLL